jgi:hypothetical protein
MNEASGAGSDSGFQMVTADVKQLVAEITAGIV